MSRVIRRTPPARGARRRPGRSTRAVGAAAIVTFLAVAACTPPGHGSTAPDTTRSAAARPTSGPTLPPVPRASTTTAAPAAPTAAGSCPRWTLLAAPAVNAADVTEASGLAGGRVNPGVWWTHNDSGDGPRVFAIEGDGRLLTTMGVSGAQAWDWEDIDIGPGPGGAPYIYVADLGDNFKVRQTTIGYQIYRFPEPRLGTLAPANLTTTAQRIDVRYPDGPHNTEATLVDPVTGDYYMVTKQQPAQVFRIPAGSLLPGRTVVPTELGEVDLSDPNSGSDIPTGAAISTDGSMIVVKTLTVTWFWPRPAGSSVGDVLLRQRPCPAVDLGSGEAVAFDASGGQVATMEEGAHRPLIRSRRS